MTQSNSHTFSSETTLSTLLNQVVLLLLGTPPVLRVVEVVDSRISMGGAHYGCA